MQDELPHISDALIADLKEIMAEDFALLITSFVSDTKSRLVGIQEKLRDRDAAAFSRACHSLKGSASNVGALRLADLCLQGEKKGVNQDLAKAEQLVLEITEEFSLVANVLEDKLTD